MPMAASSSPIRLPTSTVRDVPYEPLSSRAFHRSVAPPRKIAEL